MVEQPFLHFVETPIFTKQIDKLASIEILTAIQDELLEDPERGDLIAGTNGARKARIGDKRNRRGKSGAFRYIYVYFVHAETIYLLYFYAKNEQVTLTKQEKEELALLVGYARKSLERK